MRATRAICDQLLHLRTGDRVASARLQLLELERLASARSARIHDEVEIVSIAEGACDEHVRITHARQSRPAKRRFARTLDERSTEVARPHQPPGRGAEV